MKVSSFIVRMGLVLTLTLMAGGAFLATPGRALAAVTGSGCRTRSSGNWSDPNIWIGCTGVDGIPAPTDNVSITRGTTLDISASVVDLTLYADTILTGTPGVTLSISGTWDAQDSNSSEFDAGDSTIVFNGISGSQGIPDMYFPDGFYNLTIDNPDGVYLLRSVIVTHTLTLALGSLALNGNTLVMTDTATPISGTFDSTSMVTVDGSIFGGRLCHNFPGNPIYPYLDSYLYPIGDVNNYTPGLINFKDGAFHASICMGVENSPLMPGGPSGFNTFILRTWTVDGITPSTYATVHFHYVPLDVTGIAPEWVMSGWRYNSSDPWASILWQQLNPVSPANFYQINGTIHELAPGTQFTAGGYMFPTAVDLVNFTSLPGSAVLAWQTVSEVSTTGFNLYRAETHDGPAVLVNASLIAPQAAGSNNGSSYTFQDTSALPGQTYYYRLEAIGTDGQVLYSGSLQYLPYHLFMPVISH